jgi:hypothetical protein
LRGFGHGKLGVNEHKNLQIDNEMEMIIKFRELMKLKLH